MKIIILITLLLFAVIATSCYRHHEDGFYIFKIKKGHHRSVNRIELTNTNNLSFSFMLTESCKYSTLNPWNQNDINKLFGMSDGGNHMKNSARIGWRFIDNQFEVFAFTHYNGKFSFEKICNVLPNKEVKCQISFSENKYTFIVDAYIIEMPRYKNNNYPKYLLYPYFGGDETSPHDMFIKLKY